MNLLFAPLNFVGAAAAEAFVWHRKNLRREFGVGVVVKRKRVDVRRLFTHGLRLLLGLDVVPLRARRRSRRARRRWHFFSAIFSPAKGKSADPLPLVGRVFLN